MCNICNILRYAIILCFICNCCIIFCSTKWYGVFLKKISGNLRVERSSLKPFEMCVTLNKKILQIILHNLEQTISNKESVAFGLIRSQS